LRLVRRELRDRVRRTALHSSHRPRSSSAPTDTYATRRFSAAFPRQCSRSRPPPCPATAPTRPFEGRRVKVLWRPG
jgi:hypothetical protein